MSSVVTIQLEKPICSAGLLGDAVEQSKAAAGAASRAAAPEQQKKNLATVCQALQEAVNKLDEQYENTFKEHREQISKLSVEIARKIVGQKVQEGDYAIETIVQESLKNVPKRGDVVVHLNPEDLSEYQKVQEGAGEGSLACIKLVADASVGRAECLLETPKGVIESFINDQIERIGEALRKAE
jgi:flagellar biosynthesis/type III secretory pathway protein FliH